MEHKNLATQCQKLANVCSPVSLKKNYMNKLKYEALLHLYFPTKLSVSCIVLVLVLANVFTELVNCFGIILKS